MRPRGLSAPFVKFSSTYRYWKSPPPRKAEFDKTVRYESLEAHYERIITEEELRLLSD
jgi:hypothetical protein